MKEEGGLRRGGEKRGEQADGELQNGTWWKRRAGRVRLQGTVGRASAPAGRGGKGGAIGRSCMYDATLGVCC
eukprot:359787-Chlamydomonas_euryale.AAC.10